MPTATPALGGEAVGWEFQLQESVFEDGLGEWLVGDLVGGHILEVAGDRVAEEQL